MSTERPRGGGDQRENGDDEEERRRRWREIYGDMIPERIVDTKIGEDGKRYYKVQWAASMFEPAKNFLEAEHLIRKYWDPVERKLKLPNARNNSKNTEEENEQGASTSTAGQSSTTESSQNKKDNIDNGSSECTKIVKPETVTGTSDVFLNTDESTTNSDTSAPKIDNEDKELHNPENVQEQKPENSTQGEVSPPKDSSVKITGKRKSSSSREDKSPDEDNQNDVVCKKTKKED